MNTPKPLRVLVVEDSVDDALLLVHELRHAGYAPAYERVETAPDLKRALAGSAWDIVISDYAMPRLNGTEALHIVREYLPDVPFIMVSGTIGEDAAVDAMKAGANDYFAKDKLARLIPAIERELREARERKLRRTAELRLHQAEARFAKIFEASPAATTITTEADNRIRDVNERFLNLLGYTRDEVIGRTVGDIGFWVGPPDAQNRGREPMQKESLQGQELVIRTKAGEQRTSLISIEHIEIDDEPCLLTIYYDISERKKAEQALRESEERFRSLIVGSYDGIALIDEKGAIRYASPSSKLLLGYGEQELIGMHFLRLVHPDDAAVANERFSYLMREPGRTALALFRVQHRDGTWPWIEVRGTNSLDEHGLHGIILNYRDVTERKRFEDALRESERFARATVDALSAHIAILDEHGQILAVNRAWRQFAEANTPENILQHAEDENYLAVCDRATGEDAGYARAVADGIRRVMRGEADSIAVEYPCPAPSGMLWFVCRVTRFHGPGPVRVVVAHENITERKLAELELTSLYNATSVLFRAENVYKLGQQIVDAVIEEFGQINCSLLLVNDGDGEVMYIAQAGEHRVDTTPRLTIDGPGLIARAVRTGTIVYAPDVAMEDDYIDCNPLAVSELVIPLIASRGVVGALDLQSDRRDALSERQRRVLSAFAERAAAAIETAQLYEEINHYAGELEWSVAKRTAELYRAKEHVEAILNNSSDAIVLANLAGVIVRTNPAFHHLFGHPVNQPFPEPLSSIVEPQYLPVLEEAREAVRSTFMPRRVELAFRRVDGSVFDADVAIAPVMEYDSDDFTLIYSLRDITQRKQAEENLRKALEKEREVGELKSRFVSMVSHEFRNPLAVIQSATDLMKHYSDRLTEERKHEQLDEIHSQVRRLTSLLEDILTIGRAEQMRLQVQPEPVRLDHLVADIVRELRLTAATHSFAMDIHGVPEEISVDRRLVRQAVSNLVSNAIKYSPEHSTVRVEVGFEPEQARIVVHDQGIGIPEQDQDRLFEVFHRARNVGGIPGTGLGLAIVKQAVELHRGTVSFESEVGRGTQFTIVLPYRAPGESRETPRPG